jgi:precorrin-2 dehydrogenase/sirohydrochlorin ferrochelatase
LHERHAPSTSRALAVDDVPNCDFIAPAIVRRRDITIAISTSGRSPAMARRIREHLDATLPRTWGDLLEVAASARENWVRRGRWSSPRHGRTRSAARSSGSPPRAT